MTSLKKRFTSSLLGNLTRSAISFLTMLLLARWLTPTDYGRMSYLLASFVAIRQLLEVATSTAFFTFLSQKNRGKFFLLYYWGWVFFQLMLTISVLIILIPASLITIIWQNESISVIILAYLASFLQGSIWQSAQHMAEAQRKTLFVQKISTFIFTIHFLLVFFAHYFDYLTLVFIFSIMIFEWFIASIVVASKYKINTELNDDISESPKSVFRMFLIYCLPMIPYTWLNFIHDFADRWMLQYWSGSEHQAFYSIAQQLSAVALIATTSVLNIFWKEIAEAYKLGNQEVMQNLHKRVSRMLFVFSTFIAAFLFPWSREIVSTLLGEKYLAGVFTLSIMLFYPIHQSLGQIAGTILYATESTKLRLMLTIVFVPINLFVTYILLAPKDAIIPGFSLNSEGLAIKMVAMQIIQVSIINYFINRKFKLHSDFFYQALIFFLLLLFGLISYHTTVWSFGSLTNNTYILMSISFLIFLVQFIFICLKRPTIIGVSHSELAILQLTFKQYVLRKSESKKN